MLLVHNDDADIFQRSKDRRAGADDDAGLAAPDAAPFIIAFPIGQPAVENGNAVTEPGAETAHQLGLPGTATMVYGLGESGRQRVEHLLRIRELQSDYELRFEFGVTYQFGSKFTSIVNPRFGT